MKLSVTVLWAVVAAFAAAGALAATNENPQKSKSQNRAFESLATRHEKRMAPGTPDKACTDKGGFVVTARDGVKTCVMRGPACATTVNSSKSNSSERIDTSNLAAVTACYDACGTIAAGRDGVMMCTKPARGGAVAPGG